MNYKELWEKAIAYVSSETQSNTITLAADTLKTKDGAEIKVDSETKKTDTADGEYELEDGSTVVVKEGIVSVKEADAKDESTDPANADEVKAADGAETDKAEGEKAPEAITPEMISALTTKIDELTKALADKTAEVTKLSVEKESANTELEATKVKLSAVENEAADTMINVITPTEAKEMEPWKKAIAIAKAEAKSRK